MLEETRKQTTLSTEKRDKSLNPKLFSDNLTIQDCLRNTYESNYTALQATMRVVPLWFAIMIDCAASLRICLVCEPSPLTYVSGVATRFQKLIEYLALDANDQVELITTEVVATSKPQQWIDKVPVHYVPGWQLPLYPNMTVGGVDWTFRLARKLRKNRPDLLHVTSPGFLMVGAILWGRLMQIPLVVSYHTHIPVYVRSYCPAVVVKILEWFGTLASGRLCIR